MSYLEFAKNFFGRPEQSYVQANSWESLKDAAAMAIKEKLISIEQSLQLLAANKKMEAESKEYMKKLEKSVILDAQENGKTEQARVHEVKAPEKEARSKELDDRTRDE